MLNKNDKIIGKCSDLSEMGLGVVKTDNQVLFVKDALIGEEVEVHVTSMKKSYGYGFVSNHIQLSENRCEPKCSVFKQCGGCQLQHLDYDGQLLFKTNRVKAVFQRIAKLDVEIKDTIGMEDPWKYRNKVQVPVSCSRDGVKVGFYRNNTNDIVEYDECHVQSDLQNNIVDMIKDSIKKLGIAKFFRHILVKHAHNSNEVMVVLIVNKYPMPRIEALKHTLINEYKEIKSIIINVNKREDNVILGDKEFVIYGTNKIVEFLDDYKFNISAKSFYQINPIQTSVLYNKAIEFANIQPNEVVADVYCGTGTLGIFAAKHAKKVIGIEIVPEAIVDAKANAELNNVKNISFLCGDAGEFTAKLVAKKIAVDVAIVDPPRKGLDDTTINALVKMKPSRIVYVSCDPGTLARDCAKFNELGYKVELVQPVDMFPQSVHVESVVLMSKK